MRVVVAAAVRLFREGLADVLGREPAIEVAGTAADAAEIEERVAELEADLLLADASLLSEARVLRLRGRYPALKIVALGAFDEPDEVVAYAEAGVQGFVTREQALDELVRTLESVVRGEMHCAPHVAAALLHRVAATAGRRASGRGATVTRLTARELEIVDLLADGLSNKEIARRLSIEVPTVKNHVHNILEKLEVRSRFDAGSWARGEAVAR